MNPLDRFFKNKLSEPQAYPGMDEQWDAVEELLNQEKPGFFKWIVLFLSVLVLVAFGLWMFWPVSGEAGGQTGREAVDGFRQMLPGEESPEEVFQAEPETFLSDGKQPGAQSAVQKSDAQRQTLAPVQSDEKAESRAFEQTQTEKPPVKTGSLTQQQAGEPSLAFAAKSGTSSPPSSPVPATVPDRAQPGSFDTALRQNRSLLLPATIKTLNPLVQANSRNLHPGMAAAERGAAMTRPLSRLSLGGRIEAGVHFTTTEQALDLAVLAFAERPLNDQWDAHLSLGAERKSLPNVLAGQSKQESFDFVYNRTDYILRAHSAYLLRAGLGLQWRSGSRQSWMLELQATYLTGLYGKMYEHYYPPREENLSPAERQEFAEQLQNWSQTGMETEKPHFYRETLLSTAWLSVADWKKWGWNVSLNWRLHLRQMPDLGLYARYSLSGVQTGLNRNGEGSVGVVLFF